MLSHHHKFLCQNQSKSYTAFLAYHSPRAMHLPGLKILPRFVKVLHFSSLCVKFQPTECNISINFDHFSNSPNYVRGVTHFFSSSTSSPTCVQLKYPLVSQAAAATGATVVAETAKLLATQQVTQGMQQVTQHGCSAEVNPRIREQAPAPLSDSFTFNGIGQQTDFQTREGIKQTSTQTISHNSDND